MSALQNKRVLLGVTGGIAAYKSPDIVRRLRDMGAQVKVVMTESAIEFITPLTLQAVSGERVHTNLLDPEAEAAMGHIELARWADLIVVAPATADSLSRIVQGRADDLLGTLILASDAPKLLAPAMNQAMWRDVTTQQNIDLLTDKGFAFIGPEQGSQACGDVGFGRMSEPAEIAQAAAQQFESTALSGRHIVITAGPTLEPIDPVRYVSNHSSGKMGFAIAEAAAAAGARVTLVAGPVALATPERVDRRIDVTTADDMLEAVNGLLGSIDIFIATAAVADFKPQHCSDQKLKKQDGQQQMTLTLIKNPDILATVAGAEHRPSYVVGFAAETSALREHAVDKLVRKRLDMIVANDVSRSDIGFGSDDNQVTVFTAAGEKVFDRCDKAQLARQLVNMIAEACEFQQAD